MGRPPRTPLPRCAAAVGATALMTAGAFAATAATAGSASAATNIVHAKYKVSGTTYLAGPESSLTLGPGTLKATVNLSSGKISATLSLPPATGSFTELGIVPVTATAQFINDGPTTGRLNTHTGAVSTKSKITLQLTSLSVAGIPVAVGKSCETASPVVVRLKGQKGFNVLDGGTIAGSYTIGDFQSCGLATSLINLTIPASGNTISLTLGKAKITK
jgi:hypothetical protein